MTDNHKKIGLAFGATGMLHEALVDLAETHETVFSFSRGLIKRRLPDNVTHIGLDFSNMDALRAVNLIVHLNYEIQSILIWVHSDNHQFVSRFFESLPENFSGQIVQVFGTSTSSGMRPSDFKNKFPALNYASVVLGSKNGRWLTNHEISQGAQLAFQTAKDVFVGN